MNIYEKLLFAQGGMRVPKSNFNAFGKYSYRNCEDILEAFKPLGKTIKALIMINDELEKIGERYYVKSTVSFVDAETSEIITNVAYAREEDVKKGMDSSQVTGATSSYARKYALNGLFCIDDTKDSDFTNSEDKSNSPQAQNKSQPSKQAEQSKQSETPYKCEICGKPFTDFEWNKKKYTAKDGYEISKKKCDGKALCNDCKKKTVGQKGSEQT